MYYIVSYNLQSDQDDGVEDEVEEALRNVTQYYSRHAESTWVVKATGSQLARVYRQVDGVLDPRDELMVAEVRARNLETNADLP